MKLTTRLAIATDAQAISTLLLANAAAKGGALYGDWSLAVVRAWIASDACVVLAFEGDNLAGVLFTDHPGAAAAPPVLAALQVWPAKPGSYIYGPVCVAEAYRGQGIFELLLNRLALTMKGREGVLFIARDNKRSLRAHQRMGMQERASFELEGKAYAVLTYNGARTPA
ncbi:GNAT family N-acetyltransferase [Pseudomonas sp. HR96]|uniref:GNAT family N-acetyltransferase n=1 Tax=Pseudomonas sp. HR96 TaxID=1027966 RepID=UPI002A7543EF|nr:GNAT family N-acetyltransferase [Pseudomonas sp. HR96]WPO99822.1 GNAT family N-acetyltransferase [Pseudomonas sp. HR96]